MKGTDSGASSQAEMSDGADVVSRVSALTVEGLNNPLRREALRILHRSSTPLSGMQMAPYIRVKDADSKMAHHLGVLKRLGLVALVKERKVRGAKEKLYLSLVADNAVVGSILKDTDEEDADLRRGSVAPVG